MSIGISRIYSRDFTQLPEYVLSDIIQKSDTRTILQLRATSRTMKLLCDRWMNASVAAERVLHDPTLYVRLDRIALLEDKKIFGHALTNKPELIEDPAILESHKNDAEMKKTALVAAKFLHKEDLVQRLIKDDPKLSELSSEMSRSDGAYYKTTRKLLKIVPFVVIAVRENGWALEFADPELKKDRAIV
jgi:hypothetical protein